MRLGIEPGCEHEHCAVDQSSDNADQGKKPKEAWHLAILNRKNGETRTLPVYWEHSPGDNGAEADAWLPVRSNLRLAQGSNQT